VESRKRVPVVSSRIGEYFIGSSSMTAYRSVSEKLCMYAGFQPAGQRAINVRFIDPGAAENSLCSLRIPIVVV
jgi:hypothetical protein